MNPREPKRWSAQADGGDAAELLAGLRAARDEGPSAEQLARMRAALSLGPALAPASGLGWPIKLIAVSLVVAGASFGAWRALRPTERAAAPSQPIAKELPRVAPGLEPPELIHDAALEPVVAMEPRDERPRASAKSRRAKPATVSPAPAPVPANVEAELALLRPARAHVRSAPARALELVAEHARLYPRGALIEEREVIAIEALLESGRGQPARLRAADFFDRFPRSAHARRVRTLLEEAGVGASDHE